MSASRPISPDRVPRARADGADAADAPPDLAALRRRIAALERRPAALEGAADESRAGRPWPLGIDALDGALPEGGLAPDGLHEAAGASTADGPSAAAFLAALLARHARAGERGPVLVYRTLRLSLRAHPLSFLRERLAARGVLPAEALLRARDGDRAATAGLVLVRQRPGSAKGVIFMTLEDETGTVNVVVWPKILEKYRPAVLGARLAMVRGRIQRAGEIVHLVAAHLEDLSHWLDLLTPDQGTAPRGGRRLAASPSRHPRNQRVIPNSRDFR